MTFNGCVLRLRRCSQTHRSFISPVMCASQQGSACASASAKQAGFYHCASSLVLYLMYLVRLVSGRFDFAGEARYQEISPPHLFAGQGAHTKATRVRSLSQAAQRCHARFRPDHFRHDYWYYAHSRVGAISAAFSVTPRPRSAPVKHTAMVLHGGEKKRQS